MQSLAAYWAAMQAVRWAASSAIPPGARWAALSLRALPCQFLLMVLQLLQQNGGVQGVLAKVQQAGYGQQAQSWIGTGANLPIDPRIVQQVFGQGQLGQIAQQLGISPAQASDGVAQMLPQVVDQMTPAGQIPENHSDLVNEALAILQRGRGG